jgi:hypothetical protein
MAKKTDGQSVECGVHADSTPPATRTVKRDEPRAPQAAARPSSLLDTRVIYCGGPCRTGQCWGLPREITPRATTPHRLHRISRGETKEKRAFEDRHESTRAYIDYMRPRCVQLARVLKKTGSFYYHCDWNVNVADI